jgi:hypothetical protein
MVRKPDWQIKDRILQSLRDRPKSMSELAHSIGSDIKTTKKHLEELRLIGEKVGYPVIIETPFSNFRGCEVVIIYSVR